MTTAKPSSEDWPSSVPALVSGNAVTPLIAAEETYAALADAIRGARQSVHMAYWTVDPGMSPDGADAAQSGESWRDLLTDAVRRGVHVRLILSDFDPIAAADLHEAAWTSYRDLMGARNRLPENVRERLSVQCVLHEAALGSLANLAVQPIARKLLAGTIQKINDRCARGEHDAAWRGLGNMPGLWPVVSVDDNGVRRRRAVLPPVHPGSHHEKLCIIDATTAFIGGLDIEPKRYDTIDYDARDAWHDLACRVEGPVVRMVEDHFVKRWNGHAAGFRRRLQDLVAPGPIPPLPFCDAAPIHDAGPAAAQPVVGDIDATIAYTVSGHRHSPFALGPKARLRDVAELYRHAVSAAQRFIYIETQFFRSLDMADWLAERGRANPELQVIMLLPLVPERISVNPDPNPATRHGQYLQGQALDRVRAALGDRFGAFTLLRNGPAPARVNAEAQAHGSDQIYVHSKAMLVDDDLAIVGSANLNGRSFLTDTETALCWRHPVDVGAFRERLWGVLFRQDVTGWSQNPLARWRRAAQANRDAAPGQRQGFVLPMPDTHAAIKARKSRIVPDRLV